jgi:flagellar biosynthesis protein FlhG
VTSTARPSLLRAVRRRPGATAPADQADGLRRLFGARAACCVPVVANPHVGGAAVALEALASAFAGLRRHVLVVDAADTSPDAPEAATLGLSGCVQWLGPQLAYLAARGLPRRFVDTRGSAVRMLDEIQAAAPDADLVVVHAEAIDLARIFKGFPARPVLLAADHPESVKHAYACWKLLARRCAWLGADLLLAAAEPSRTAQIAASVSQCAEDFFDGELAAWAAAAPGGSEEDDDLRRLALAQLQRGDALAGSPLAEPAFARRAPRRAR